MLIVNPGAGFGGRRSSAAPNVPSWSAVSLLIQPTAANYAAGTYSTAATGQALTYSGDAALTSSSAVSGGAGIAFSAGGVVAPTSPALALDGDFTVEVWLRWNGTSHTYQNFLGPNATAWGGNSCFFRVWGTSMGSGLAGRVGLGNPAHDGTAAINSSTILTPGTAYHIAAVRTADVIRLHVNGVLEATGGVDTAIYDFGINGVSIGRSPWDGASGYFGGTVHAVRIVKGQALAIALPTAPWPTQ